MEPSESPGKTYFFCPESTREIRNFWEFPNLVVSNLVVCNFCAEALFCALLRSFADLRLRAFALFCVFLRTTAFRTTAFGNCRNFSRIIVSESFFARNALCQRVKDRVRRSRLILENQVLSLLRLGELEEDRVGGGKHGPIWQNCVFNQVLKGFWPSI